VSHSVPVPRSIEWPGTPFQDEDASADARELSRVVLLNLTRVREAEDDGHSIGSFARLRNSTSRLCSATWR